MIKFINDPKIQNFIQEHLEDDPGKLVLAGHRYPDIPVDFAATQIKARQKSLVKLPWIKNYPAFLFPSTKSYEQSSSYLTAGFKGKQFSGNSLLDLSGGLGIDSLSFSENFKKVTYIERDKETFDAAEHNFKVLGKGNIHCLHCTAEDYVVTNKDTFDMVYVDPARRDTYGNRITLLEDSEPNIIDLLPKLWEFTDLILLKAAPMLDIHSVLKKIPVKKVYVIAVQNECKELLFLIKNSPEQEALIHTVNIQKNGITHFDFTYSMEAQMEPDYQLPLNFLYEPNAAILKAGAFKSITRDQSLYKLHEHTHIYTSKKLVRDFPGRAFKIIKEVPADKKKLKKLIPDMKANISARNYPLSVAEIRRKTGLKDGGKLFIFALKTIHGKNSLILTEKL